MQSNDQQNDIQSLRKELLQAEQQRLDLESDKVSLSEKSKFLEIDKGKVTGKFKSCQSSDKKRTTVYFG